MHALVLLGCLFGGPASGDTAPQDTRVPADPLVRKHFSAGIEITLDRRKLADVGLTAVDAASVIEAFFKNHRTFKLSELRALKLAAIDGRVHELKDFATVDIDFKTSTRNTATEAFGCPRLPQGVAGPVQPNALPMSLGVLLQPNQDVRSALNQIQGIEGQLGVVIAARPDEGVRSALERAGGDIGTASQHGMPAIIVIPVKTTQP